MNLVTVEPVWRPDCQQRMYRRLLDAMSYPGRIFDLANDLGDSPAELGILACVVDDIVAFADPDARLDARRRNMLHAPYVAPELADYILHDARQEPPSGYAPRLGDLYRPDASATLILSGAAIGHGPLTLHLEGPGIESHTTLQLDGFHPHWFAAREHWVANFPQGVDIFLCDQTTVAALPRTCQVTLNT